MPEIISTKAALRRELLADRQAIAAEVRREWNAAICARLMAWHDARQVRTLGVFSPIRGEPDLRAA
ncbi:MAG: 5-formyltetrahydrofolate cyclo-ligase, partial [Noviherbaspirillum sp.]